MHRVFLLVLLLLMHVLVACSSGNQTMGTPPPAATQPSAPARPAGPAANSDEPSPLLETYVRLLQNYVEPVQSDALLTASLENVRAEVIRSGVVGANVEMPAFTGDPEQDWPLFQAAFATAVDRYDSKLSSTALAHAAIRGMVSHLDDCHTAFLDPPQYEEQVRSFRGETRFGGIGASLRKPKETDPLVIWHVFENTPAARAGLKPGDVILAVDGQSVSDLSIEQAVQLIRGAEGAPVDLTIQRGSEAAQVYTVTRAAIQPPAVEAQILDGGIGYLQIYSFPLVLTNQVDQALAEFKRQQIRAMIIDVRNNPGGSLDAATQVLSRFVKEGLLFYIWDRQDQRTDFSADGASYHGLDVPTVVLVNEGTGSGGEIFAAALQEQQAATVVGARTAGCVGTGRIFPLTDGSAIQITVGRILTGQRNRALNGLGLVPDEDVPMSIDDLTAGRDPQFERALDLVSQPQG